MPTRQITTTQIPTTDSPTTETATDTPATASPTAESGTGTPTTATTTDAAAEEPSVFAAPAADWLDAVAGPNHGRRLPVRIAGVHLDTEVTLGAPWRLTDGAVSRSVLIVALTDDGRVSRHLPAVSGEIVMTADDRIRCHVGGVEGRAGAGRWVMRRAARAVLAQLTAAATTGRSSTTSTSSNSSGTSERSRSFTRSSPSWNASIPASTA